MKYMGSKRTMLKNGLGDVIDKSIASAPKVYDLFTGSGAVASHIAQRYQKAVIAVDLQTFAVVLAKSVLERDSAIADNSWICRWFARASAVQDMAMLKAASDLQESLITLEPEVAAALARKIATETENHPITSAYGGYYFSPLQSMWLDDLRRTLPKVKEHKDIALACLVRAASSCAAAPGHTAQPFKANPTAGPFLIEAWLRNLPKIVRETALFLSTQYAKVKGRSFVMDANIAAHDVQEDDLVFLDPPYSDVHYSRFYHVLETVARGEVGSIKGSGRYPPQEERPRSDYSLRTQSRTALDGLLSTLASRGANVLMTFPAGQASNGLSGAEVIEASSKHFKLIETKVTSRLSTLGGDRKHRAARQDSEELILYLSAK
ncbi:Adenine-specific DNA methylase [Congregibacter litoralis KT71]|uniref:site-specific DNA-methyltransferase (adenine-specific) n=2 Tax=Congregibacter TaxID=393661 RepID=A4ABC6_9GAMM|nr:Adenine-specific DNA methylase [Congregibacter litoralis KT71]